MELERLNQEIRPVTLKDESIIATFLDKSIKLHRHLDWRSELDWLGAQPFFIRLDNGTPEAILACLAETDGMFWIRLFGACNSLDPADAWLSLFPSILEFIRRTSLTFRIAALPYQAWFHQILIKCGWIKINEIVQLSMKSLKIDKPYKGSEIRKLTHEDLTSVYAIDKVCFDVLWNHNFHGLELALQQAYYATTIIIEGKIAGYQISTASHGHLHIARLAVNPDLRRQGIGGRLVADVIGYAHQTAHYEVTVNTQADNPASLSLYQRCGFQRTGEDFPIFQHPNY